MREDIDYVVCISCDTPCYTFELDRKGAIESAYCQACGTDEPAGFRIPDADEMAGEE
jgi:hypothetical protein